MCKMICSSEIRILVIVNRWVSCLDIMLYNSKVCWEWGWWRRLKVVVKMMVACTSYMSLFLTHLTSGTVRWKWGCEWRETTTISSLTPPFETSHTMRKTSTLERIVTRLFLCGVGRELRWCCKTNLLMS